MASYSLLIKPSAAKEIEALPLKDRRRMVAKIRHLSTEPRPSGCEKLTGRDRYRIRQGNYRALYEICDLDKTIIVVKLAHRREAYR